MCGPQTVMLIYLDALAEANGEALRSLVSLRLTTIGSLTNKGEQSFSLSYTCFRIQWLVGLNEMASVELATGYYQLVPSERQQGKLLSEKLLVLATEAEAAHEKTNQVRHC